MVCLLSKVEVTDLLKLSSCGLTRVVLKALLVTMVPGRFYHRQEQKKSRFSPSHFPLKLSVQKKNIYA